MSQNSDPEAGFYRRRLVRGGPWIGARVWFHEGERDELGELLEDEGWRCEVDGRARNPYEEWEFLCGEPIDEPEFNYLMACRDHALEHDPDSPYSTPHKPIDLGSMPPIF